MAEGDVVKADYIGNCSYYEFHYRQLNWNMYQEKMKEHYEKNKKK